MLESACIVASFYSNQKLHQKYHSQKFNQIPSKKSGSESVSIKKVKSKKVRSKILVKIIYILRMKTSEAEDCI